ncbi:response regulator transcription factor [Cryptosporangium sp. NPDC048952]|uniref:response regulator transcription factor n=1 Tax=Cryptosporangium sp. NPDC048952 TaxID=3363961 RepID=UPI00371C8B5F
MTLDAGAQVPVLGNGQRILVIADDPETIDVLSTTLGLAHYVVEVATGNAALARLTEHRFDLLMIDSKVSDSSALTLEHRPLGDRPPALVLADDDALPNVVSRLRHNCDDYVVTPFRLVDLLARTRRLLRSSETEAGREELRYADLVLDDARCQAWRGTRELDLTPAEYRLLRYLVANAEQVLTKEQIGRHLWGGDRSGNSIEKLVSRLRTKVNQQPPALIGTRRGFGYLLGRSGH